MAKYRERTLPDGTELSTDVQYLFHSYGDMAHNAGTVRAHGCRSPFNDHLDASIRTSAWADLLNALPLRYAATAHEALLGYVEYSVRCHSDAPELCNTCTGQEFAYLSPHYRASGLSADLYTLLVARSEERLPRRVLSDVSPARSVVREPALH